MKSGINITSESISEKGNYPVYGGNGLRGYTNEYTHEGVHVLIGRQGALCGNINYSVEGKFWASEHAVVVKPSIDLNIRWLGELLVSMNLNQYSIAAAQPGLSVDKIINLLIPLPGYNYQKIISRFIEDGTILIDQAISRCEKEISLIQEYRDRLVADVVTGRVDVRGIDVPDVPAGDDLIVDDENTDGDGEELMEDENTEDVE
jgi:type I restriction enzyme S subunit